MEITGIYRGRSRIVERNSNVAGWTEQFIGRLNTYINVLQEAIDTMKGAVDKIGEPRSSSPNKSKPVPLTGIRRATILRRLAA